jgi:hypothetical protein
MGSQFIGRALLVVTLSVIPLAWGQPKVSVDETVDRHIQALGGRQKLDSVRTLIIRGEYREGSFVMPGAFMAKMENARTAFPRALQIDPTFKQATDGMNALR